MSHHTDTLEICGVNEIDSDAVAQVQSQALTERTIDGLSRLFSALSDPTRLKILHALSVIDELCVCDLAAVAELSVSAVSHQLRLLKDRNIVSSRRDGRMVYYRITDDKVRALLAVDTT